MRSQSLRTPRLGFQLAHDDRMVDLPVGGLAQGDSRIALEAGQETVLLELPGPFKHVELVDDDQRERPALGTRPVPLSAPLITSRPTYRRSTGPLEKLQKIMRPGYWEGDAPSCGDKAYLVLDEGDLVESPPR